MKEFYQPYRDYLTYHCRLEKRRIADYMGCLPSIMRDLRVSSPAEISEQRVLEAWRASRWETTEYGIQLSEKNEARYSVALKEFLAYLEKSGSPVPSGLSELIKLSPRHREALSGLEPHEVKQLKEFLLFNVSTDRQRRDTALCLLMLTADLSLDEALALQIDSSGALFTEEQKARKSGTFQWSGSELFLKLEGKDGVYRQVRVERDTWIFLKFYLENRKISSSNLFVRHSGKEPEAQLSRSAALKLLLKVIDASDIRVGAEQLEEVLRKTAQPIAGSTTGESRARKPIEPRVAIDEVAIVYPMNQRAA